MIDVDLTANLGRYVLITRLCTTCKQMATHMPLTLLSLVTLTLLVLVTLAINHVAQELGSLSAAVQLLSTVLSPAAELQLSQ